MKLASSPRNSASTRDHAGDSTLCRFWAVSAAIFVFLDSVAVGNSYIVRLLHPPTGIAYSYASGVSNSHQVGSGSGRALLWSGTAESVVDLHPSGYDVSGAGRIFGEYQVGWGTLSAAGYRALLWKGTAESVVDLTPIGFTQAFANGVWGDTQVGTGYSPGAGRYHALMWQGSADSYSDLHPAGYESSSILSNFGSNQVGFGDAGTMLSEKALMWSGTAASAISLHPASYLYSVARALDATSQVGVGVNGEDVQEHALLWHGSAASVIDLHPDGFLSSRANDVWNGMQVGYGSQGGRHDHALLWKGSAESVIDLHSYVTGLPVSLEWSSAAAIGEDGTIVGYGLDSNGNEHAIMWIPVVPEPASGFTLLVGASILFTRRSAPVRTRSSVRKR